MPEARSTNFRFVVLDYLGTTEGETESMAHALATLFFWVRDETAYDAATMHALRRLPATQSSTVYLGYLLAKPIRAQLKERIKEELVGECSGLVASLSLRFRNPSVPLDDLMQAAWKKFFEALNNFSPVRGKFEDYVCVSMIGELKRYLRDKSSAVRIPRPLQELSVKVRKCREELEQRLRRSVTIEDIAAELRVPRELVAEAMIAHAARYEHASLHSAAGSYQNLVLEEILGFTDEAFERIEAEDQIRELKQYIRELPPRLQRILYLRYKLNLSQAKIAAEIGISQMHVSRLLTHVLGQIRAMLRKKQSL